MKKLQYLTFIIIISILAACSSVQTDYDRNVNFNNFKTYNYFSNIEWGNYSELDARRFYQAIDNQMAGKGFTKSENPDFIIDIQPTQRQTKRTTSSVNVGVSNWGRGVSVGGSVGIPIRTKQLDNQIVIEMVNASNDQMIWQGIYEKTTSAKADKNRVIENAVDKIFAKFPPKK